MPSIAYPYDNTLNLLGELLCGEATCNRAQFSMITILRKNGSHYMYAKDKSYNNVLFQEHERTRQ